MAAVKRAVSRDVCSGLDPDTAHRLTPQKAVESIEKARTGQVKPYRPVLPMAVTIQMSTVEAASVAAQKPGVERVGECTVRARVQRQYRCSCGPLVVIVPT